MIAIRKSANISKCGRFRWSLLREWNANLPRVCYIGHNPSIADANLEDPTTRAWANFARLNGYGSYVAVNLYPLRTPDPKEVYVWAAFEDNGPDWYARDILVENRGYVAEQAKLVAQGGGIVVASWGAIAKDELWVDSIAEEIQNGVEPYPPIYCLGKTSSGAPKHPMARGRHRIPSHKKFEFWRNTDEIALQFQEESL